MNRRNLAGVLAALIFFSGCAASDESPSASKASTQSTTSNSPTPGEPSIAVPTPGELPQRAGFIAPDIMVQSETSFDKALIKKVKKLPGVAVLESLSIGSFFADGRQVKYAAVDPDSFRRFAPVSTGGALAVWQRVAGGEIAISPKLGKKLADDDGYLSIGNADDAMKVHVGALAPVMNPNPQGVSLLNAVLNYKWAEKLGLPANNALLISTGAKSPNKTLAAVKKLLPKKASALLLAHVFDTQTVQTAILTGGSLAGAVGTFRYTANRDGSVNPESAWVAANIRTESVPILGQVRCHRVMLPQLRAALTEIEQRGLSKYVYHYDGCYVPRYIGRDPARGLSYHTFGTAIDINAAENGRGRRGNIPPQIVQIFKKWGFAWGGDWAWTDPMHFELARLVSVE